MKRPLPVVGVRELEAIYAELPTMDCKGLCGECCGPSGKPPFWTLETLKRAMKKRCK